MLATHQPRCGSDAVTIRWPAALRTFGNVPSIYGWFKDAGAALLATVRSNEVFQDELAVQRLEAEHWHSLRATPITDAVTGGRAVLLQQLDIQKRRDAENQAAARSRLVDERRRDPNWTSGARSVLQ